MVARLAYLAAQIRDSASIAKANMHFAIAAEFNRLLQPYHHLMDVMELGVIG